jgi:hypothetical protein
MGTEVAVGRERLTERELQILDHLEQAQGLDVPLTEYASAYGLDVKDLYNGKAQLVKKGLLPSRTPAPERTTLFCMTISDQVVAQRCALQARLLTPPDFTPYCLKAVRTVRVACPFVTRPQGIRIDRTRESDVRWIGW